MKILYLISTLKNCGPVNVLYDIVRHIDKKKFDIEIVTLSPEHRDSKLEIFYDLGIDVVQLNLSRIKGLFFAEKRVKSQIDKFKPDIIHSHGFRGDILNSKISDGLNSKITTIHNYLFDDYKMRYSILLYRYMVYSHIKALRKINNPITISKSLCSKYQEKNILSSAIANGINEDRYKYEIHDTVHIDQIKKELDIPLDKKVIISVGHLSKLKDPLTTIKGFIESKFNGSFVLLFLGDGEEFDACKRLATGYINIIFKGRVSNVEEYLKISDYFISSSTTEGFGLSLAEAMACGNTPILTDLDVFREIVGDLPAFFFKINDHRQLSRIIDLICVEERTMLQEKISKKVLSKYGSKIMSKKYQDLYLSMNSD